MFMKLEDGKVCLETCALGVHIRLCFEPLQWHW